MIARYWGYCGSCGLCVSGGKSGRGIIGGSSCGVSWVLDGVKIKMTKRKRIRTSVGVFRLVFIWIGSLCFCFYFFMKVILL